MRFDYRNFPKLQAGDRIIDGTAEGEVQVEVLRAPEQYPDFFGRPALRCWARRLDTGQEGWLPGPVLANLAARLGDEDANPDEMW